MGSKIHLRITKDIKRRKIKNILLFLDYDGTLVPIKKKPDLAKISKTNISLLKALSKKRGIKIFIVSGRTLKNVMSLVKLKSVSYVGNHGFELWDRKIKFRNILAEGAKNAIAEINKKLKKNLKIKGSIIENKFYTLSIHFRLVKKRDIEKLKNKVYNVAASLLKKKKLVLTKGKKVIEIRPNLEWNKGSIVNWLIKKLKLKNALAIYIGDDRTDEDAFKALGGKAITVLVSKNKKPTKARYRLESPQKVSILLKSIKDLKYVR